MTFHEHVAEFDGKPVVDYTPGTPLDPEGHSYRLRLEYDADVSFQELLADFLAADGADRVTGLLTGAYSEEMYDDSMSTVVEPVIAAAPQLPSLAALFIGDIIVDENEVSWIQQTDLSPVWDAFPRLREFRARGGQNLSLGQIAHDQLQRLVIETGGLPKNVLAEIAAARLPELEHLELWLGDSGYGWNGSVKNLKPILSGQLFPKLKYLGLRNSEIADQVAQAVCNSPLIERIETLDLSMGTLGDEGGQALLNCPHVAKLQVLDLHHHYMSTPVMQQVQALPPRVDVSDQESADEDDDRYVSVGE
jgi:hypothetical protein